MPAENVLTEQDLPPDVIEAIRGGRKVEAIKLLRERNGLGLANAKVLVDRAWRTHGPVRPIPSFADQSGGLSAFAKILTVLLLITAAVYFMTDA